MRFLIVFLLFFSLFAKEQKPSDISPVEMFYINLEPGICDENCLKELLKDELLISFLARFDKTLITDNTLIREYIRLTKDNVMRIDVANSSQIAVIIPQKVIRSYAQVVSRSLMAYLAQSGTMAKLIFISSDDESFANIQRAVKIARDMGIGYFIAPLTTNGVNILNEILNQNELAFVPTIHSSLVPNAKANFIFGGVDYNAQILELLKLSNHKITAFSDASATADAINEQVRVLFGSEIYEIKMATKEINLKSYFTRISAINNSSIFLNLPLVKASLIATQLKTFEIKPYALLSTQINFDPKLINLIKENDRKELYVANSIGSINNALLSRNDLLNIDLRYSFLGYSSSIGLDYIINLIDSSKPRIFKEDVVDNQVIYDVNIFKTNSYSFEKLELKNDTNSSLSLQGLE